MPSKLEVQFVGIKELRRAVKRNPRVVKQETKNYIQRGLAVYKRGIIRNPWRVGSQGGGSPVSDDPRYIRKNQKQRSGNLRDSHKTIIRPFKGRIKVDESQAPYAKYVHNGTRYMKARPWLDYVRQTKETEIEKLYGKLLTNITKDLAK